MEHPTSSAGFGGSLPPYELVGLRSGSCRTAISLASEDFPGPGQLFGVGGGFGSSHAPGEGLDAPFPLLFGNAQLGVIERGPKQVGHIARLLFGYLYGAGLTPGSYGYLGRFHYSVPLLGPEAKKRVNLSGLIDVVEIGDQLSIPLGNSGRRGLVACSVPDGDRGP